MLPIELRVSAALDSECRDTVISAVTWLEREAGRDLFIPVVVPPDDAAVQGYPTPGVVGVTTEAALLPRNTLGQATRFLRRRTPFYVGAAFVEVRVCSAWVLAHELGHAVGLDHNPSARGVMHAAAEGGWELSAEDRYRLGLGGPRPLRNGHAPQPCY